MATRRKKETEKQNTYISPDDKTFPPGTIFRALAAGSDARLIETETAGRRRLTDREAEFGLAFEIGWRETLAGKIPAKMLLGVLAGTLVPEGRARCNGLTAGGGRFDVGIPEDCVGATGFWALEVGPTGGWILLLMTTYFWSLDAEKDKVVPFLTLRAIFRGTFNKTGLPPLWGLTRIETWSAVESFAAEGVVVAVVADVLVAVKVEFCWLFCCCCGGVCCCCCCCDGFCVGLTAM